MATTKKAKTKKIKISYINDNGYKRITFVTPEELKILSRILNITIE